MGNRLNFSILLVVMIFIVAILSFADSHFLEFTDPPYLYDDGSTVFFNETRLNETIQTAILSDVVDIWVNESGDTMTGLLNITAFGTGNVLIGQEDLAIGNESYGAYTMGAYQNFISDLTVAGMDLNGTVIFRKTAGVGSSNVEFAWATSDNLIRLAIPIAGTDFAMYNPRSMMVGGGLGQSFDDDIINCTAQGYQYIDCDTSGTGADIGVQDDVEVNGTLYSEEINLTNATIFLNGSDLVMRVS